MYMPFPPYNCDFGRWPRLTCLGLMESVTRLQRDKLATVSSISDVNALIYGAMSVLSCLGWRMLILFLCMEDVEFIAERRFV